MKLKEMAGAAKGKQMQAPKKTTLKRNIINSPRDKEGLFIQPKEVGPERELIEQHNRMNAAHCADYADPWTGNPRTFDPTGNYRCGECNKAEKTVCVGLIKITISPKAGSCAKWEDLCAGDPELRASGVMTAEQVGYGEAKNGEGFGCHRCDEYVEKAYAADSKGRDLYCRKWDCRVLWNTCCQLNSSPVVTEYEGDKPIGKES